MNPFIKLPIKLPAKSLVKLLGLTALAIMIVGCSSKTMVESNLRIKGAPDWVNEGTSILKNRDGRYFHGIGSAPLMADQSLQIATADNRARTEIARILSSYMEVAYNDYTASSSNQTGEALSETEISRQIQNATKVNLAGAHIIGHWRDKRTNMIYALAELDMKQVKKTLAKVTDMNEQARQFIIDKGDNIFDRSHQESK